MNEVITFLENKGVSIESINKILNIFSNIKCDDDSILNCLEYLYNLFSFAGLTNEQITMLLQNSRVIFDAYYKNFNDIKQYYKVNNCKVDNFYIYKLASVLKKTNYLDDIFESNKHFYGSTNYKRIFLRSYIYDRNRTVQYYKNRLITASEKVAYSSISTFNFIVESVLNKIISNDTELENELTRRMQSNPGQENMTVEKYITHMALKFHRDFFNYMKEKNCNNRGIK